jgi:hypothetical protein
MRTGSRGTTTKGATCAGERRKFWQTHDQLFQNQDKLQVADLRQYAAGLGLDT